MPDLALDLGTAFNADPQTATNTAAIALKADALYSINAQVGTSYTLVLGDAGKLVTMNNAGASILTVPANASVAVPIGAIVTVQQLGAGQLTLAITSDTLNQPGLTYKLRAQFSVVTLIKNTSTTWTVLGDLAVV
jgi:hypothetical protein